MVAGVGAFEAILLVGGLLVIPCIIWAIVWWNSFTLPATIAIQTGKSLDQYVLRHDKMKVKHKNGAYVLSFRKTRGRTPSFPGEVWQQFDMAGKIRRGVVLYMTTEGEFHPMDVISKKVLRLKRDEHGNIMRDDNGNPMKEEVDEPVVKILSQDNREFILNQCVEIGQLTQTPRERIMTVLIIAIAAIVIGAMFIITLVYLSDKASNLCSMAPGAAQSANSTVLNAVQGVVGG